MNTTLTLLLLVALTINIVCDIVRLWTFHRTVEESKDNVKETICDALDKAYNDWLSDIKGQIFFSDYFRKYFDKYL